MEQVEARKEEEEFDKLMKFQQPDKTWKLKDVAEFLDDSETNLKTQMNTIMEKIPVENREAKFVNLLVVMLLQDRFKKFDLEDILKEDKLDDAVSWNHFNGAEGRR